MFEHLNTHIVGLGLALGLGFLVGLEREWAADKPIGLRSFTLIGGSGGLAALLAEVWSGWIVGAGLLSVAALVVGHQVRLQPKANANGNGADPPGITTLLAAVAVFLVGAACVAGYQLHGVVMGGAITILLHWKRPLHGLVDRIGEVEFSAVTRFVLITLVVLPILPNRTFGPYAVLNPFQTWLLVVLIVGLSMVGYVAFRLLKAELGALVGGVVGGLVSSTATTISFASLTRAHRALVPSAVLVILIASAVVYARVAVELGVVAPALLPHVALPMLVFALAMVLAALVVYPRLRGQRVELPEQKNPARLKVALSFAVLYALSILGVAAARDYFGDDAIYAVAILSGLTQVDAITLSVGQLFSRGQVDADLAWRSIFVATLANLAFKIGAGCVLGDGALRRYLLTLGGALLAGGIAILFLWP